MPLNILELIGVEIVVGIEPSEQRLGQRFGLQSVALDDLSVVELQG